jgi:hypothetical protein
LELQQLFQFSINKRRQCIELLFLDKGKRGVGWGEGEEKEGGRRKKREISLKLSKASSYKGTHSTFLFLSHCQLPHIFHWGL